MMIAAGLAVAGIGMIPAFVAIVASPEKVLAYEPLQGLFSLLNISTAQDLLVWGSGALVGVFVIKSIYVVTFNYFEARFIFNRRYIVSHNLMRAYMQAPYTFHLGRNTAELLRNISQEVNLVINGVFINLLQISREAIMSLSILIFLFAWEPLITLFVITVSGLGAGSFLFLTQKRVKQSGVEEQGHRREMIKAVNQGLGGIKDARILNREPEFIKAFSDKAYASTRLMAYIRFIQQIPKPVVETTAVITMMLISALMVWQGRSMDTIIPILTLFAMATVRLMPSVQKISSLVTKLKYNLVALDPLYDDMKELEDTSREFNRDRKSKQTLRLENEITAEQITYVYPGSENTEKALDNVSFTIPKGDAVAFVGESGAGKSTIVDLLLGLLEPTEGTIYVDGKNIQESLSAWQKNIGYIPQSIYLADETIRSNVAFGIPKEHVNDDDVWQALELAQLTDMIAKMPNGLDTIIGERGTRISGGQRQRVGIARALYHNPEVLVMDEATSALDNVTEKEITKAIESLRGERTVILIAHRLTTVENCDTLYLMKDGKILDQGSYDELIDGNRDFRKMALVAEP